MGKTASRRTTGRTNSYCTCGDERTSASSWRLHSCSKGARSLRRFEATKGLFLNSTANEAFSCVSELRAETARTLFLFFKSITPKSHCDTCKFTCLRHQTVLFRSSLSIPPLYFGLFSQCLVATRVPLCLPRAPPPRPPASANVVIYTEKSDNSLRAKSC